MSRTAYGDRPFTTPKVPFTKTRLWFARFHPMIASARHERCTIHSNRATDVALSVVIRFGAACRVDAAGSVRQRPGRSWRATSGQGDLQDSFERGSERRRRLTRRRRIAKSWEAARARGAHARGRKGVRKGGRCSDWRALAENRAGAPPDKATLFGNLGVILIQKHQSMGRSRIQRCPAGLLQQVASRRDSARRVRGTSGQAGADRGIPVRARLSKTPVLLQMREPARPASLGHRAMECLPRPRSPGSNRAHV